MPTGGLHRSNAIHRRRRRTLTANEDEPLLLQEPNENDEDTNAIVRPLTDGDTVVDDQGFQDDYSWTDIPQSYQRTGQNIVQLLFRVSEDATRRNAYVHRGCACNSCGIVPIRGIRYRCANCADFDLCEACEAQGVHTKTHIFYKVRVPAPSFGPRQIQPVWYSGDPDACLRALPKELITKLSRETGFERPEIDAYWEQWTFMANTEWREDPDDIYLAMDRKTFERCLVPTGGHRHAAPTLIFDRMFAFYDSNRDNLIGFSEFLHGLAYRKKRDKWRKIFEGYDIDGDGYVDRKDFLRMFRSYYVLYRQMHRDMLEGLDEQVMSSTDAQQVVTSRQPLSSAFGRDGRFPPAPDPHTGEGKAPQSNGDLDINDGKGVINESRNDTGNREDIFTRSFPTRDAVGRDLWNTVLRARNREIGGYWDAMINPPESMEQLPDLLLGLSRLQGQLEDVVNATSDSNRDHGRGEVFDPEDISTASSENGDLSIPPEDDRRWPPNFVTETDAQEVEGPGARLATVSRRATRRAIIVHALAKKQARKDIHERWKRRQFYTDEEEGAVPPADWDESEDILVQNGDEREGEGESSKIQPQSQPISPRSRSSSKVRFVEDTDDYETRSNPSTSSRSVPERWGGMEIPDAEKDAGKEIFYQVTQQAFNELLDPLFKAKEDLAVDVASTKAERQKYKDLYTTPEFEKWAVTKEAENKRRGTKSSSSIKTPPISQAQLWPGFPGLLETEAESVRERPLEELLAETGYTVVPPEEGNDSMPELEEIPGAESNLQPAEVIGEFYFRASTSGTEITEAVRSESSSQLPSVGTSTPSVEIIEIIGETESYRDPTMPQFRPNSLHVAVAKEVEKVEIVTSPTIAYTPDTTPTSHISLEDEAAKLKVDKKRLYSLWKHEKAIKEAEQRGGWGRLSFNEFEELVKKHVKGGRGNTMDYLGSWIEFCIPP